MNDARIVEKSPGEWTGQNWMGKMCWMEVVVFMSSAMPPDSMIAAVERAPGSEHAGKHVNSRIVCGNKVDRAGM